MSLSLASSKARLLQGVATLTFLFLIPPGAYAATLQFAATTTGSDPGMSLADNSFGAIAGCVFTGTRPSLATELSFNSHGGASISYPLDIIHQFNPLDPPISTSLLTYLQANPGTYTIIEIPPGTGAPACDNALSTYTNSGSFSWNNGFNGNVPQGAPLDRTVIWTVIPFDGSTVSSSTPLSLETLGNIVHYRDSDYLHIRFSAPSNTSFYFGSFQGQNVFNIPLPAPLAGSSTSFDVSTTGPMLPEGLYTLGEEIDQPYTVLGITLWTTTLTSTTTRFVVGSPVDAAAFLAQATSTASFCNSQSQSSINACLATDLNSCINLLFTPCPATINQWGSLGGEIRTKPPLGYFTLMATMLGAGSTTSASTTLAGISVIGAFVAPLYDGVIAIIWLLLALWIFHRLRNFNFQS